MPTDPRQSPQSQAPYCAEARAGTDDGSSTRIGSDAARVLMPSRARREMIGLLLFEYSASTVDMLVLQASYEAYHVISPE